MGKVKEFETRKFEAVRNILILLWTNIGMDCPSNHEEIVQYVYDDVCETADPIQWHSGDVAIAFRRWIEAQAKENVRDGATLIPCSNGMVDSKGNVHMVEPMCAEDVSIGKTIYRMAELRYLLEGLDDHDQICIETCDEHGDVEDLYPMYVDVIEGIELTDGTVVREVRFCQRPNSEPDTRDKQKVVDALIDVLAEDIEKGDVTVLDELLLRMPYDVLKYALPEDMWADFENFKGE